MLPRRGARDFVGVDRRIVTRFRIAEGGAGKDLAIFDVGIGTPAPIICVDDRSVVERGSDNLCCSRLPPEGECFIIVLYILKHGKTYLLHIGHTGGLARLLPCLSEDREQYGGKNRDNRDNDKQFDQRET